MEEEKYIKKMADDLDENCNAFCCGWSEEIPTLKFAQCLYSAGYKKVSDVIEEIRQRMYKVECSIQATALDYAYKLNAEWDKIFEEYGVDINVIK